MIGINIAVRRTGWINVVEWLVMNQAALFGYCIFIVYFSRYGHSKSLV